MKKYIYLLIFLMMAMVSVGVTSCGDDEDEPKGSDIVGTWQLKTVEEDMVYESLVQFTKNGNWHSVDIFTEGEETEVEVDHGTYSVSGNTLKVTYTDDGVSITESFTFVVKGDKLMLTIQDYPVAMTYTRVKDSVIEKYL